MTALGFIETEGMLAAIEAADTMVKAADVRLLEKNLIGAGLVTITITGEVSAVRASIDAAIIAVGRIEGTKLLSAHVIARPYDEVTQIIAPTQPLAVPRSNESPESEPKAAVEAPASSTAVADAEVKTEQDDVKLIDIKPVPEPKCFTISELKRMQVSRLRHIASNLGDLSLSKSETKSATKKKLIEAILNATTR
ncbi:MAG: microcompartment protein [Desulfotalea sp.]|nr:MAG: microcompartment protein [Desulfotalea sp.]